MKKYLKTFKEVSIYDPTYEQIKFINYQNSLDENQLRPILKLEFILRNPNLNAFRRSLKLLIERHESLRTHFEIGREGIKQCVIPYNKNIMSVSHYKIGNKYDKRSLVYNILNECEKNLMKINIPPLFKCIIINMDMDKSYLYIFIHHIISDDWSLKIISNELRTYYSSFTNGKSIRIKPLKMQLRDYGFYQKKWMKEKGDLVSHYWQNKLECILKYDSFDKAYFSNVFTSYSKIDGIVRNITNRKELLCALNTVKSFSCISYIDFDLYNCMVRVSSVCKISIGAIIVTSLQLLFHLLFDKKDILFQMILSDRRIPETKEIIGCLLSGIYLYHQFKDELSYKNFANLVYMDFINSARYPIFSHKEIGLDGEILRFHSDVHLNFVSKNFIANGYAHKRKVDEGHHIEVGVEFCALTCMVTEYDDHILFIWKYNPSIYSSKLIDCMVDNHTKILSCITKNPEIPIKDIMNSLRIPGK